MPNPRTPLINGIAHSWSSITLTIMGVPIAGITKIDYSDDQEIEGNMGAGAKNVSVGYGSIKTEGSITLYAEEVEALTAASTTGRLQDIPPFDIVVSYTSGGKVHTHRLISVIFKKNSRSSSAGDKKIEVEIPLFIGDIKWK